ncbi:hypothetical protein [Aminobacter sp. LjRoot7]|uniref:hypothetical protein n=1 Tax=Aminobacter sp. LjRoot7 TaxID=3342335 RepID=UPI003ECED04A
MLAPDVSIKDIWNILNDNKSYAETILNSLDHCIREHGNARVRIGRDGNGKYPSYRVVYDIHASDGTKTECVFNSYIDSGKPFPKDFAFVVPGDWSTFHTTTAQLEELLAVEIQKRRNRALGKKT